MTKIYIALVLIAAILGVGYIEYSAAESTAAEIHSLVEKAERFAREEDPETRKYCKEINENWEAHKPVLKLFLPQGDLDETSIAVDSVEVYAQIEDYDNVLVQLTELHDLVHSISESEKVSIYNLL